MKFCPKCQANVEGLLYRCDCCGALLDQKKSFFTCGIYELPQCLGFASLVYEMVDALQPKNSEKYADFLEQVGISMVCYPKWMLTDGKIVNRLSYSLKKKCAKLTITVNYNEFVYADEKKKAELVAAALLQGIHMLQIRLQKNQLCIADIVTKSDTLLNKYFSDSSK